jgi:SAM-dependent methyltransferase
MDDQEYLHMYEEEDRHWWYAGCGTGYTMGWFRKRYGACVAGIDTHPHGLEFCRTRGERLLVRGDVATLPFGGDCFDLVASFDVLSEVENDVSRVRALGEFFRVLKPEGRIIVRVPAYEWLKSSHDTGVSTRHRYGRTELCRVLLDAGFQPLRLTYANSLLFPGAALWRLCKKAGLAPYGSDVRSSTRGAGWMNRSLLAVLEAEAALLRGERFRFPFGLSIFAVAQKPGSG